MTAGQLVTMTAEQRTDKCKTSSAAPGEPLRRDADGQMEVQMHRQCSMQRLDSGDIQAAVVFMGGTPNSAACSQKCCREARRKSTAHLQQALQQGVKRRHQKRAMLRRCNKRRCRHQLCTEAQLRLLLRELPSTTRRSVLDKFFTETQRLALEQWIVTQQKPVSSRVSVRGCSSNLRCHGDVRGAVTCSLVDRETKMLGPVSCDCRVADPGCSSTLSPHSLDRMGWRLPKSGFRGVHCRIKSGRTTYCANIVAGPLLVSTKYQPDLALAIRFHEVLASIQKRLFSSAMGNEPSVVNQTENTLREAMEGEPLKHGFDASADMGLRFSAVVPAKYWAGTSLKTPQFAISELQEGFRAWRLLSEARARVYGGRTNRYTILHRHSPEELEAAWPDLRQAYLDVWATAGFNRDRVAARLQALEERHFACRQRRAARWSGDFHETAEDRAVTSNIPPLVPASTRICMRWEMCDGKHVAGRMVKVEGASQEGQDRHLSSLVRRIRRILARWQLPSWSYVRSAAQGNTIMDIDFTLSGGKTSKVHSLADQCETRQEPLLYNTHADSSAVKRPSKKLHIHETTHPRNSADCTSKKLPIQETAHPRNCTSKKLHERLAIAAHPRNSSTSFRLPSRTMSTRNGCNAGTHNCASTSGMTGSVMNASTGSSMSSATTLSSSSSASMC